MISEWLNRCHIGDVREVLARMVADGVKAHMCITSPPYWGLRDYGVERQIGLERTPEQYVSTMVGVFRLVRELLAEDGTLWLNIGDSYAGCWCGNSMPPDGGTQRPGTPGFQSLDNRYPARSGAVPIGLKPKDLVGIPWRLAFALQADGWYLRSDIIWHKPNPMPESVRDRPTKAHEYLFLLSKRKRYYYDAEAIKEPATDTGRINGRAGRDEDLRARPPGSHPRTLARLDWTECGRNRRSVWTIPTAAYSEAHFATFPRRLVEPCILAGTSQRGHCPECGKRWTRVVERTNASNPENERIPDYDVPGLEKHKSHDRVRRLDGKNYRHVWSATNGFQPSCACSLDSAPEVVLDPFLGSGTVAQVAQHLGRHWIGIDLNPQYAAMHTKRTAQQAMVLA